VNVTRPYLVGEQEVPFPPKQVVVEVLEDVPREPEVVAGCRRLTLNGYTLALDDYVWGGDGDPLLQFGVVVILAVGFDQLRKPKLQSVGLVFLRWQRHFFVPSSAAFGVSRHQLGTT
jgi:c-di-GMP-related signal transduction protein